MWRGGAGQVGLDEVLARRIGVLLGIPGTADVVDAMVVLVAAEAGAAVITADPGDLAKLAEAVGVRVPLIVL